jgi:hypothetical protein
MLRTAELLPPTGLSTLGFDPTRFQTEPPACYRASWQLLGRDSHPLATTSLCWISSLHQHLQPWAHGGSRLGKPLRRALSREGTSSGDELIAAIRAI